MKSLNLGIPGSRSLTVKRSGNESLILSSVLPGEMALVSFWGLVEYGVVVGPMLEDKCSLMGLGRGASWEEAFISACPSLRYNSSLVVFICELVSLLSLIFSLATDAV